MPAFLNEQKQNEEHHKEDKQRNRVAQSTKNRHMHMSATVFFRQKSHRFVIRPASPFSRLFVAGVGHTEKAAFHPPGIAFRLKNFAAVQRVFQRLLASFHRLIGLNMHTPLLSLVPAGTTTAA